MAYFRLAGCEVIVTPGLTVTLFGDGKFCEASHEPQPGQEQRAKEMGFSDVWEMNRTHDLTHTLLAHLFGLNASPTLYQVAQGKAAPYWREEEAAVLAVQAYANAIGVDLVGVAKRLSLGG